MRWSFLLSVAVLALGLTPFASADELLRLRLRDGSGPVEVRLIAWDFRNQRLTVELADGSRRELGPADLHDSDRRAVDKLLNRQLSGRDPGNPPAPPNAADPAYLTGSDTTRDVELHGVHWLADRDEALRLALGKEAADDDRPVLWFRVLGNLSGFM